MTGNNEVASGEKVVRGITQRILGDTKALTEAVLMAVVEASVEEVLAGEKKHKKPRQQEGDVEEKIIATHCRQCRRRLFPAPLYYIRTKRLQTICVVCSTEQVAHKMNAAGDRISGALLMARARLLRYMPMSKWQHLRLET